MQMKSCVVLGGGIWQEFLVRFLKEKGYFVHVVNPLVTPTVKLGDHHLQLDIRNANAIYEALLKDGYRPSFVVSDQSDIAVMPVAQLAQKFGLPGNPPEAIALFTEKNRMYDYADSLGIPVLPHALVRESRDVSEFLKRCDFPIGRSCQIQQIAVAFPLSVPPPMSRRRIGMRWKTRIQHATQETVHHGDTKTVLS